LKTLKAEVANTEKELKKATAAETVGKGRGREGGRKGGREGGREGRGTFTTPELAPILN
jgi:hypothetical protein